MSDIKHVIERLCKLLAGIGFTKITAEVVRKAKFDKENSVKPFWKLLAEVFVLKELNWTLAGDTWKLLVNKLDKDDLLIDYVKDNFLQLGYTKPALYKLSSTHTFGSRELLIAFAWLLTNMDPLQQLLANSFDPDNIDHKYLQLCQTTLPSLNPEMPISGSLVTDETKIADSHHARLEQLIWFVGKVRLSSRKLLQLHNEEMHLLTKFHSMRTESVTVRGCKLSKLHAQLLLQPNLLEQYLQVINQETDLIELYIQWKDVEDNFWKWMVSVLDLNEENADSVEIEEGLYLSICRAVCVRQLSKMEQHSRLQPSLEEIEIVPYEENAPRLERLGDVCFKLQCYKEGLVTDLAEHQENCRLTLETLSKRFPNVTCRKPLRRC